MNPLNLFRKKKKRIDDDQRPYVTKDMPAGDFVVANDMSWEYREKVLPAAFTLEFWENSGLVRFLLDDRFLRSEILDVGCGSGEIDIIIAKRGYNITGVDISPRAILLAQKQLENYPECPGRLRFLACNIEETVFEEKFSSAIISHTLEHVLSPEKTIERIISLLKPGSFILVAVPNKKAWRDSRAHLRHYSERSLRKFLSKYSNEVETRVDKVERMIFGVLKVPGNTSR